MNGQHLVVVSVDAMVWEDLSCLEGLPNFKRILENGSRVERVKSIYPTLTHPIHASIMTGCYPEKTGVCNNEILDVGNPAPPWYNSLSQVRVKTIFHAAKEAGLTTCACRWPVTAGKEEIIDYLIPEVIFQDSENPLEVYLETGSAPVFQEIKHLFQGNTAGKHPVYDDEEIEIAAYLLKAKKPDLLFTHPGFVDNARHQNGVFHPAVTQAMEQTDQWLGRLFQAAEEAGIYENTNFIVLSDHGQLDIKRTVRPNAILREWGLISEENGVITGWDAFVQSAGLSAQVFVKNKSRREEVYSLLCQMRDEGIYGISQVFTAEEAQEQYHLAGAFSFVLESDGYSAFDEGIEYPLGSPVTDTMDYRLGRGTHGHLPEKGPQPPFLCMGPGFKQGVVLPRASIVDEAPTMARLMGLSLPDADGSPLLELLK